MGGSNSDVGEQAGQACSSCVLCASFVRPSRQNHTTTLTHSVFTAPPDELGSSVAMADGIVHSLAGTSNRRFDFLLDPTTGRW